VEAHYNLHEFEDEKRRALAMWANEIDRILAGSGGKVVPLRKARRK
jgi:hypothetical protein